MNYLKAYLTESKSSYSYRIKTSEEVTDDASPKKPKGMPGKKKEYKTIDEFLEDGEYKVKIIAYKDKFWF